MKHKLLILPIVLLLAACGTLPSKKPQTDMATFDFLFLPAGAQVYIAVDVKKARPLLDDFILTLNIKNKKNIELLLDKSRTAAAGYYGSPSSRRYLLVSSGKGYPAGALNTALLFSPLWKKNKSVDGASYWRNEKSKMSLSLQRSKARISDADPYFEGEGTAAPQAYIAFTENTALSLWTPNANLLKNIFTIMEIPVNIPVTEFFAGIVPDGDVWKIVCCLEATSLGQARAVYSMLNLARKNRNNFNIPLPAVEPFIDLFVSAELTVDGSSVLIQSGSLTTANLSALVSALLVKNKT